MIASIKDNDIEAAALINDIDVALAGLQDIAGITDGGVAAHVFSDMDFDWETATTDARVRMLHVWIKTERNFEQD